MNENLTEGPVEKESGAQREPRLCVLLDPAGNFAGVASDVPLRIYIVDEGAPMDRVYQLTEGIGVHTGVQHVTAVLGDDPVGHMNDNTLLGSGLGQKHGPARPTIALEPPPG